MRWNFFWLCSIAIPDFSDCSSRIEAKSFTFYCESSNCLAKILLYLWSAKKKLRSHFRVIFVEVVRKFLHTVLMTFRHENICKLGHYGSNYSHLTCLYSLQTLLEKYPRENCHFLRLEYSLCSLRSHRCKLFIVGFSAFL